MENVILPKMLFVLIGNNNSGKTTLQKLLISKLCDEWYEKLPVNKKLDVIHPEIKRKYHQVSFANRSYQEKKHIYGSVDEYFENNFEDCRISFVSSHVVQSDIEEIIRNGRRKFFNVYGVFMTNSIAHDRNENSNISELNWDERFTMYNPPVLEDQVFNQLNQIAENFVDVLISRTSIS